MDDIQVDFGIQGRLDLYMPRQAGRIVRPDDVVDICGDIVNAQDQLKIWQSRHSETSDQMDMGTGRIGVKVYYSASKDPEQSIIEDNWHRKAKWKKKNAERRILG